MSDQHKLMELAARVEAASGPDRELFIDAYEVAFGNPEVSPIAHWPGWKMPDTWERLTSLIAAEAWVDAAYLFLPNGRGRWPQVEYTSPNPNGPGDHRVKIWPEGGRPVRGGSAHSFAIALLAAALKARASS